MSSINKHIVFGLVAMLAVAMVASANSIATEAPVAVPATNSSGSIIGSIGRLGSKVVNTITGVGSSVISRGVGLFRTNPAQAAVQQEVYEQAGNLSQTAMGANNEVMDAVTTFGQEAAAQATQGQAPAEANAEQQQSAAAPAEESAEQQQAAAATAEESAEQQQAQAAPAEENAEQKQAAEAQGSENAEGAVQEPAPEVQGENPAQQQQQQQESNQAGTEAAPEAAAQQPAEEQQQQSENKTEATQQN